MMRSPITGLLILLLQGSMLMAQSTRSVIQVFNPKGTEQVVLDVTGDVEVLAAPGSLIQVETEVTLANAGDPILKALIMAKRYHLDNLSEGSTLFLSYTHPLAPVQVRGKRLDEQVRYRIYLPKGLEAVMKDRSPGIATPE